MQVRRMRRVGVALVTVATATALTVGGGAKAADSAGSGDSAYTVATGPVTIKMKLKFVGKGKKRHPVPFFVGPKKVSKGAKMTVVNKTAPKAIGPHTFSLVKAGLVPHGKKGFKACENGAGVCGSIATAHQFNPKTMKVSKPTVDVGKKGWDKSFGKKGDTWYTETKGEKQTRKVTAKVGTTLTYFCAVHPNMVGKIKVVK